MEMPFDWKQKKRKSNVTQWNETDFQVQKVKKLMGLEAHQEY